MGAIQYKLTNRCRRRLLRLFPPRYANVKCDHITVQFGVDCPAELPALPKKLFAVGYASDDDGVECLVVEADGVNHKVGGGTLHITLSIADGRRSVESNDVLSKREWTRLRKKIPLRATVKYVQDP